MAAHGGGSSGSLPDVAALVPARPWWLQETLHALAKIAVTSQAKQHEDSLVVTLLKLQSSLNVDNAAQQTAREEVLSQQGLRTLISVFLAVGLREKTRLLACSILQEALELHPEIAALSPAVMAGAMQSARGQGSEIERRLAADRSRPGALRTKPRSWQRFAAQPVRRIPSPPEFGEDSGTLPHHLQRALMFDLWIPMLMAIDPEDLDSSEGVELTSPVLQAFHDLLQAAQVATTLAGPACAALMLPTVSVALRRLHAASQPHATSVERDEALAHMLETYGHIEEAIDAEAHVLAVVLGGRRILRDHLALIAKKESVNNVVESGLPEVQLSQEDEEVRNRIRAYLNELSEKLLGNWSAARQRLLRRWSSRAGAGNNFDSPRREGALSNTQSLPRLSELASKKLRGGGAASLTNQSSTTAHLKATANAEVQQRSESEHQTQTQFPMLLT